MVAHPFLWGAAAFLVSVSGWGQVSVLTQHNDAARTGANLAETALNVSNVNASQFGKLFSRTVDGQIYAQPLVVSNVNIPGKGARNVVFIATMHNSVYAFDAEDPAVTLPYWQVNLGPSVPNADVASPDIQPEIGITAAPVIDASTSTIYLVAKTKEAGSYFQRLHALDLRSGQEKASSPVVISASVPGFGFGSVGGVITFDALKQLNRPGLLLLNGRVYLAFGSHGDHLGATGWVLGYDAATLQRTAVFNANPNGWLGAIWQAGQGLAADAAGFIYLMTGNGDFDYNTGGRDLGMSFVKLRTPDLSVADWFTPYNYFNLVSEDLDLSGSGPLLIPGTNLVVGGGKEGVFHLLDRANLGHFNAGGNTQIVQNFTAAAGHIHGSPVYWNGPGGPFIYLWSESDRLKQFKFGSVFQTTPVATSAMLVPDGMPGGMLSVSANGSAAGTGIVWASHPFSLDANPATVPGILRAFDATNVGTELWNSRQNAARDDFGNFAKFCVPTIANGKVYLATFSNQLVVYGLNPPTGGSLPAPWLDQDIGSVGTLGSATFSAGTFTVKGAGSDIFLAADEFHFVYRTLSGDGQIVARVATQQNTDGWAKAGVMIRETLTASSAHAMTVITPGAGVSFQWRSVAGGGSTSQTIAGPTAPQWLKIVRSGNSFTGSYSSDGNSWTSIFTTSISIGPNAFIGLAVTSHSDPSLNNSTFDNVTVGGTSGNNPPAVAITSPANGAVFTAPVNIPINVTASDSDGIGRIDFYDGTNLLGSDSTSPYSFTWNNVPAGTHALTAVAVDGLGLPATSTPVNITVNSGGSVEVVWQKQTGPGVGQAAVWRMTGNTVTSVAALPTPNDTDYRYVAAADFGSDAAHPDGDGTSDIVLRHVSTGANIIWYMNGDAYSSGVSLPAQPDPNWEIRGTGDFDGDGRPDLLWQNRVTGQASVWFIRGAIATGVASLPTPSDTNYQFAGVGDFNGDGKADIVLRHAVTGANIIWYMNGTTYVSGVTLPTQPDLNWEIVDVGDVNGDSKPDLVWRHRFLGFNALWPIDGTIVTAMGFPTQPDVTWEIRGLR